MTRRLVITGLLIAGMLPLISSLRHGFYADDFTWLEAAYRARLDPTLLITGWRPGLIRPLGQLVFFCEFLVFGIEPLGYNILGLLIHLAVGFMVWRLAMAVGSSSFAGALSAIFFVAGLGHYIKPVIWTCSHALVIATGLALLASVILLRHLRMEGRSQSFFPVIPILLSLMAILTHDLLAPALIAVAFLAWFGRHPRRRAVGLAAIAMTACYAFATLREHAQFAELVKYQAGTHILHNAVGYMASLLVPVHSGSQLEELAQKLTLPDLFRSSLSWVSAILGVLLSLGLVLLIFIRRGLERGLLLISCLFLLVPLPLVLPRGWIDCRYIYPASAFLAPALAVILTPLCETRKRSRTLMAVVLNIIFIGILIGSTYQSNKAIHRGRLENTASRWERLHTVFHEGEAP